MKRSRSKLYWIWSAMMGRCYNPNNKAYKNYGGRGITVCERWHTSVNFVADISDRPDGYLLDRIDNDKGYSPDNCKWSTRKEQNSNRRSCIYVEINGSTVTLKEACRIKGLKYRPVNKRLKRGWDIDRAINTPIGIGNTRRVL